MLLNQFKMKNIMICRDLNIGDRVNNIQKGRICTTYPLTDFKNYNGQERNNDISEGVIIDITPKYAVLETVLIENNGNVVAVRF